MSGFMQDWLKLFDGYELAGREQYFKLSYQSILLERTLVGIPSKNLSTADLAHICRKLSMPEDLYAQFLKERDGANQILFGFEENPTGIVYKTYLEYWDRLVTEIRSRPEVVSPKLLHLGFKWDPSAPDGSTVARGVVAWLARKWDSPLIAGRYATIFADSGMPSAVIRLIILTAINASVFCESRPLARRRSPIMRLYRYIPFSARACW